MLLYKAWAIHVIFFVRTLQLFPIINSQHLIAIKQQLYELFNRFTAHQKGIPALFIQGNLR